VDAVLLLQSPERAEEENKLRRGDDAQLPGLEEEQNRGNRSAQKKKRGTAEENLG